MTVQNQNFTMFTGDSKQLRVSVADDDDEPQDLSGATIKWAMAFDYDVARSHYQILKTIANGGIQIVEPASSGVFTVDLLPEDTRNLVAAEYVHEAEVIDAEGNVSTVLRGTVTLVENLVR